VFVLFALPLRFHSPLADATLLRCCATPHCVPVLRTFVLRTFVTFFEPSKEKSRLRSR
jgi:hypothetical protein